MALIRQINLAQLLLACVMGCTLSLPSAWAAEGHDARSYSSLPAAIRSIGVTPTILQVSEPQRIEKSLVIPASITLHFQPGATLTTAAGATVTIESPITAGLHKIFLGPGKVVLKGGTALPHWWGAKGDGINDDGYAIQDAIDSMHASGGGTVRLPTGTYLLNHITGGYYALKCKDRVSVVGNGPQSKLMVGNSLRRATQGVAVLYNHEQPVTKCIFADFAVDYNGRNNLRLAYWGEKAKVSDVSRLGAEYASEVTVERLTFRNVTGAHCIYFGNQNHNHSIFIRDCQVHDVGESVPGNQSGDHSSIYVGGTGATVTGNKFYNQTPCNISTAIEIHSSNSVVANNVVANYATALNIGGEANDCENVMVQNNSFTNCRNGVVLWHYSPYVMKNMTIANSVISLREPDAPYPPSTGIVYGGSYVTSTAGMSDLVITGNTISQENVNNTSDKPNTAIYLEGVNNVTITGNTIADFKGEAIYLKSRSPQQGMHGIIISGNVIRMVGQTPVQNRKRAIALNAYPHPPGEISDVLIEKNTISGGGNLPLLYGVTFNNGLFVGITIAHNRISGAAVFEIINNASIRTGSFMVEHSGKGTPIGNLTASSGSRWLDEATGREYLFINGAWR